MRAAVPRMLACLCAQGDSNSHPAYAGQGPQPCASTNSATGAWSLAIIGLERERLDVVRPASYSTNTRSKTGPRRLAAVDLKLTKRQQEIFDFIKRYSAKHGYPPTVRDIGKAIGLGSPSTVHAHLSNLEKLGVLRRDPSKPRALEVLRETARRAVRPSGLPVVGRVAAGQPVLAEENIEEYVTVPNIAGGDDGDYVLRVSGDSMKNAGILDGDHVVVRPQDTARNGEIVVALVGEEATVKRFFKESDHIRLQPENESLEPIRTREAQVMGRVVGVCRRVD